MIVFLIILGSIVCLNIISFTINQIFFSSELASISPYGELIEINGQKMHVYSMGIGEKTIVLLPGFSVPLPCADFGPLMRELSKDYTVVCIEYFGIGFSEQTDMPRTNENYTEEIRTALSLAGYKAPYVLMPHSGSGIYSEYYAAKYPDEVSAIIMLDTTSSAKTETIVPKFVYGISKVQQSIGLNRIVNFFVVPSLLKKENGYTEKEISDYGKFINHYYNDTIADQLSRSNDNIIEVMGMDFPNEVPVLKLIASQTMKQVGDEYQTNHLSRLGVNAESITLNGSHFIYHSDAARIFEATNTFLEKYNRSR